VEQARREQTEWKTPAATPNSNFHLIRVQQKQKGLFEQAHPERLFEQAHSERLFEQARSERLLFQNFRNHNFHNYSTENTYAYIIIN
jgi:hypothetical protein